MDVEELEKIKKEVKDYEPEVLLLLAFIVNEEVERRLKK